MVDLSAHHSFRAGAAEQYGIVHREQLIGEGFTPKMIKTRLARHELKAILPNTYLIGGAPDTWHARLMAAQLWGDDCFISHRSAATLWDLDGFSDERLTEISLYSSKRHAAVITHRLDPDDRPALRQVGPLRVSSPERTLLDLSAVSAHIAQRSVEDALRRRLTTLDRLWQTLELDGGRGRKGTGRFNQLLHSLDERTHQLRSPLEQKMLEILAPIHPEGLVVDHPVRYGSKTYFLDFAYPSHLLGIETLGLRWHFGTDRWQRDLARDRHLSRLGWTILYFTWDDVTKRPWDIEKEVRSFLFPGH